jgi:uncharacterized protein (TIGR03435 family)
MRLSWKVSFFGSAVALVAIGQVSAPRPTFDVAAIKLRTGGANLVRVQPMPGGRLVVENAPLRQLILTAYRIKDYQLSGGPSGLLSEHYDIEAKAEGGSAQQSLGPRLQALLEDRFRLKVHHQTRQAPGYQLTVSKNGPKLLPAKPGGCVVFSPETPLRPFAAAGQPTFCGFRGFGVEGLNRSLDMLGVNAAELASALASSDLRAPVLDRTALTGTFDIHLRWALDAPASTASALPADAGPSILTAVQEQLGLKLQAANVPVDVLVIDHLERPSAN